MSNELKTEEYLVLLRIGVFGETDLEKLRGVLKNSQEEEGILSELETRDLIKMEFRDGDIYSFVETEKGLEEINNSEYKCWRGEFD